MSEIALTPSQRRTLTALVNEYQRSESPVAAKTVAAELDLETKSARRQMMNLREMELVEGIRGPNGGYKPTETAYAVLDRRPVGDPETGVLAREFERVDAIVDDVRFTNVHHPELCRAQIRLQQSVQGFEDGDAIAIGITPGPETDLLLAGVVDAVQRTDNVLIVDVARLETTDGPVDA